jgi:hypothetical protein
MKTVGFAPVGCIMSIPAHREQALDVVEPVEEKSHCGLNLPAGLGSSQVVENPGTQPV